MKYVLLIMILLVGCSDIEEDKPTFAKGAASALIEEYINKNFADFENTLGTRAQTGRDAYESSINRRKTGVLTEQQILKNASIYPCEPIYSYLRTNNSRGDIKILATPINDYGPRPTPAFATEPYKEIKAPFYLQPIVIEGLVEEYVGEGVWRVELKLNLLSLYDMYGDPTEFEPYVWEVYEPLGNIKRISKEYREYC